MKNISINMKSNIVGWAKKNNLKFNQDKYNNARFYMENGGRFSDIKLMDYPYAKDAILQADSLIDDKCSKIAMYDVLFLNRDKVDVVKLDLILKHEDTNTFYKDKYEGKSKYYLYRNDANEFIKMFWSIDTKASLEMFFKKAKEDAYCFVFERKALYSKVYLLYLKSEMDKVMQSLTNECDNIVDELVRLRNEKDKKEEVFEKAREEKDAIVKQIDDLEMKRYRYRIMVRAMKNKKLSEY